MYLLYLFTSTHLIYSEGTNVYICGRLGAQKMRITRQKYIYIDAQMFVRLGGLHGAIGALVVRTSKTHLLVEYTIRYLLFSIHFGFFCKFRFESRLYRARFRVTSFVFRLGIAHKVEYCLPMWLRVHRFAKKKMRYYYTLCGIEREEVRKTGQLFRSFRIPDLYSRLGIFIRGQYEEWRLGMKKMRV